MSTSWNDRILLSLGSNLGERKEHMARGVSALESLPGIEILAVSRLYETRPWGGPAGQGPFLNAALCLHSRLLSMSALLEEILAIELQEGRVRQEVNGPRTLDIDILLCGQRCMESSSLCIPHVAMHERSFVLQPASEIAPDMRHPLLGLTVAQLAERVGAAGLLRRLPERGWYHAVGHSTCQ